MPFRPPATGLDRSAGVPLRSGSSRPLYDWLAGDAGDRSGGDVRAHLHPLELDPLGGIVRPIARLGRRPSEGGQIEPPAAGGYDLAVALRGAGVGDLGQLGRGLETADHLALG